MEKPLFRVDNAKSQMSVCKTCCKVIAFRALRIGVTDYNEGRLNDLTCSPGWNHVDCFYRRSSYLWWMKHLVRNYPTHLVGYNALSNENKSRIKKHMVELEGRDITRPRCSDPEYFYSDSEEDEDFTPAPTKQRKMNEITAQKDNKKTKKSAIPGAASALESEDGPSAKRKNSKKQKMGHIDSNKDGGTHWTPQKELRPTASKDDTLEKKPEAKNNNNTVPGDEDINVQVAYISGDIYARVKTPLSYNGHFVSLISYQAGY
ncbi:uncharacterized protein LOC101855960 [Aplysia californica]|uniref:Uncharacterized protein LOC101855960 n=1 Tax=Aplysia californica TaxID=6500 RepID=A0ABM0JVL8_APLCA|nr:uncharacterized protein LOC101855960 [Aplysia californica]